METRPSKARLFVALDGVYVEGLLHVTELGNDYFNYDKARHEMAGERTGMRYRLGDRLRVKVSRVDLEASRIDFVLAGPSAEAAAAPKSLPNSAKSTARIAGKASSRGKAADAERPARAKAAGADHSAKTHSKKTKPATRRQPTTKASKGNRKK